VQAAEVAAKLAGLRTDVAALPFIASPLGRTRETMEILRAHLGMPKDGYEVDERWRELSFGAWEGMTWREVRKNDPDGAKRRERDKWNFVPPEGESYAMLARRVEPAVHALPAASVVVAHGGVARALLHSLSGFSEDKAPMLDIWQGRVLVFEDDGHRWH
jgi:broad specificity phosphatase PhoE